MAGGFGTRIGSGSKLGSRRPSTEAGPLAGYSTGPSTEADTSSEASNYGSERSHPHSLAGGIFCINHCHPAGVQALCQNSIFNYPLPQRCGCGNEPESVTVETIEPGSSQENVNACEETQCFQDAVDSARPGEEIVQPRFGHRGLGSLDGSSALANLQREQNEIYGARNVFVPPFENGRRYFASESTPLKDLARLYDDIGGPSRLGGFAPYPFAPAPTPIRPLPTYAQLEYAQSVARRNVAAYVRSATRGLTALEHDANDSRAFQRRVLQADFDFAMEELRQAEFRQARDLAIARETLKTEAEEKQDNMAEDQDLEYEDLDNYVMGACKGCEARGGLAEKQEATVEQVKGLLQDMMLRPGRMTNNERLNEMLEAYHNVDRDFFKVIIKKGKGKVKETDENETKTKTDVIGEAEVGVEVGEASGSGGADAEEGSDDSIVVVG